MKKNEINSEKYTAWFTDFFTRVYEFYVRALSTKIPHDFARVISCETSHVISS